MAAMVAYMSVPDAYGIVEPGVYRAKAADPANVPFLLHLRLRLKVWKPFATWKPVSEELIKDALEILLDVNNHPIMVMCSSGIQQTGTVVGCLRRLQKWNLTSLLEEYRRYAGSKARYANEQFMELFDEDLVTLPRDLPAWFIDQRRMMEVEEAEFRRLQESGQSLRNGPESFSPTSSESVAEEVASEEMSKVVTVSQETTSAPGSSWRAYCLRSSPLTTEDRSYKRKIIGKVE